MLVQGWTYWMIFLLLQVWLHIQNKNVFANTVELVQSDILWHSTKIYSPKVFLLAKINPEYSNILYNPTHFPVPLVCQIIPVPLYLKLKRVAKITTYTVNIAVGPREVEFT